MERSKGLQSGELGGQISSDQWFSMLAFSQFWVILAVWARKAFSIPAKSLVLCRHILLLRVVFSHYIILEMGSFLMSVANNFCDEPLPKYLYSKTVLIYCPHPVYFSTYSTYFFQIVHYSGVYLLRTTLQFYICV